MKFRIVPKTVLRRGLTCLTATLCLLTAAPSVAEKAVFVTGYSINTDKPPELPAEYAGLTDAADIGLSMGLNYFGFDPGTREYADIMQAVDEFYDAVRPQDRQTQRGSFSALYQTCMLRYAMPPRIMAIRLPPAGAYAYMEGYDWSTHEGFSVELARDLDATRQASGEGWNSGLTMSATGATDTMLGYDVAEYSFRSRGGLGNAGQAISSPQQSGAGGIASMVSVNVSGTAWVSDDVDGIGIVQTFYGNLADQVVAGQGANSFYGGLMRNMAGLLQRGLPLHISQSTKSSVAGQTMMSGTSESWVTHVAVIDRKAECATSTIPADEDYEITHIAASGMPGGSGGGAGAGPGAGAGVGAGTAGAQGGSAQGGQLNQPCDCSCAAFERLQQEGKNRKGDGGPEDQAMAMCMAQCMRQFMACAMQGNR